MAVCVLNVSLCVWLVGMPVGVCSVNSCTIETAQPEASVGLRANDPAPLVTVRQSANPHCLAVVRLQKFRHKLILPFGFDSDKVSLKKSIRSSGTL